MFSFRLEEVRRRACGGLEIGNIHFQSSRKYALNTYRLETHLEGQEEQGWKSSSFRFFRKSLKGLLELLFATKKFGNYIIVQKRIPPSFVYLGEEENVDQQYTESCLQESHSVRRIGHYEQGA